VYYPVLGIALTSADRRAMIGAEIYRDAAS